MNTSNIADVSPFVSVIIPFYNNIEWLREALISVLEQTYRNMEIIVINDGSKEDISLLQKEFEDKIIFVHQENQGSASARNHGIRIAKGEYIAFLDSDDIWLPEKLDKQIKFMNETGAIWSHTSYQKFGNSNNEVLRIDSFCGNVYPRILCSATIGTPCVIVRGEILKNNPEFRFKEDMKNGQDYFLWIKLSQNYPLYGINEVLCKVRQRGANTARKARSQIVVRGNIYKYIVAHQTKDVSIPIRLAYKICAVVSPAISNISNTSLAEIIAKISYVIPYLIFKHETKKMPINNKDTFVL